MRRIPDRSIAGQEGLQSGELWWWKSAVDPSPGIRSRAPDGQVSGGGSEVDTGLVMIVSH